MSKPLLKCPECPASIELGGRFTYVQTCLAYRRITEAEDGCLVIQHEAADDDTTRPDRIRCSSCDTSFPIPEGFFDVADWD